MILYHYTSKDCAKLILDSKTIKKSKKVDKVSFSLLVRNGNVFINAHKVMLDRVASLNFRCFIVF